MISQESTTEKLKVLIADDSGLMRLIISDILNKAGDIEVVDTATDGKDAVEKAHKLKPDVVVLDMYMGDFDGIYAVKNILKERKVPILILSSVGNTNLEPIMEALHLGAFDYLNKPNNGNAKVREVGLQLVDKVRVAGRQNKTGLRTVQQREKPNQNNHTFGHLNFDIIAIGASTGGPTAVENVVRNLPSNLPIPVVIAQHMPANFVPSFVKRLNNSTPLEVIEGIEGMEVIPGRVIVSPGGKNMVVKRDVLRQKHVIGFSDEHYREFNGPSVNALFNSVSRIFGKKTIAVVLTGMGKDGANGAKSIFDKGGYTIAQNKETSAVYGMPKSVVDSGVAKSVVPLNEISGFVVSCLA